MFGQNEVKSPIHWAGLWYVQEVFLTIQGEGPLTGTPAVFVRMRHCNLRCTFCDTDFTTGTLDLTTDKLLEQIEVARSNAKSAADLVVITGGEPMLQDIGRLIPEIITRLGMRVQVETAGTVWPESFYQNAITHYLHAGDGKLTLVCSPKTPKVHPRMQATCRDWKYIISSKHTRDAADGLPTQGTQPGVLDARLYRPAFANDAIWLQPCEEWADGVVDAEATKRNVELACTLAMRHGYRLSLQTHKLLGLP